MYIYNLDIQEFYPSITEDLLKQAILFAQNSVTISPKSIDVIFHSLKSLLYHNDDPKIIENIQFGKVSSAFLLKLGEDIKNMKSSSADKT